MALNHWVCWALWQLGVFFVPCCGAFHTVLLSWGKAPTVGCEPHRDALSLATSPPCGFRQRPNTHHPSLCPNGYFITLFSSLSCLRLLGTMESFEKGKWRPYGLWLWSCSLLQQGRILYIATRWSHFLGGPLPWSCALTHTERNNRDLNHQLCADEHMLEAL